VKKTKTKNSSWTASQSIFAWSCAPQVANLLLTLFSPYGAFRQLVHTVVFFLEKCVRIDLMRLRRVNKERDWGG